MVRINGYEIKGTATMNRQHAEVIQRGEARMPRKGEPCDMSCAFAFACANYVDNGNCVGFQLLSNGKLERHIRDNILMDESDRLGIQRYIEMIQQTNSPQIKAELVPVVLRYLKPPEKLRTMIGYTQYEIHPDGTLSLPDPPPPQPKIPDPEPECMLMLKMNEKKRIDEEK